MPAYIRCPGCNQTYLVADEALNHRARFSCTEQLEGFLSCEE
jgi:hypothetical protein